MRDFALYFAIFVAFVALVFVIEHKWGHEAFIRWGGLIGYTGALFGYFISASRQYFRNRSFWGVTCAMLALHLVGFSVTLTHVDKWKLIWFTGMIFELPVLIWVRDHMLPPT